MAAAYGRGEDGGVGVCVFFLALERVRAGDLWSVDLRPWTILPLFVPERENGEEQQQQQQQQEEIETVFPPIS